MLAYVFWHWPQSTIERQLYEDLLVSFQRTLKSYRPDGLKEAAIFHVSQMPWIGHDGDAYEEWYLLEDSAALDRLNRAAVSGACEEPHNRVAMQAAGGVAGLYRLRTGEEILTHSRVATWFTKPTGLSYNHLESTLQSVISPPGTGLWGRQMTLGPTPEFCIHSPSGVQLSTEFRAVTISQELIWSGSTDNR